MSQKDTPNNVNMAQIPDPIPASQAKDDKNRGRRRSRGSSIKDENVKNENVDTSPVDGPDGHSSGTDGPSRKRRRSRKGLDKKFECPEPGCGKSYSRAEHL